MIPSKACVDLVKQFEGCSLHAYPDPATGGVPWTIGWGATGLGIRPGVSWTQEQADQRLVQDLQLSGLGVLKALSAAPTTQNQMDAMTSLAFNIGVAAFTKSTVAARHRARDYPGAADAFLMWTKGNGRTMKGLIRRREAERELYLGNG